MSAADKPLGVRVISRGPFDAGAVMWRDRRGKAVATLIAKATYELSQGEAAPIDVPLPIQEEDVHWDDDPSRSVHVPSDLAPFKSSAEVVIVGSAFAPNDRPSPSVVARVVVGFVDKTVEAWGPRRFRGEGRIDEAPQQHRFSLRYEHAAGGPETDNPAGIDLGRSDMWGHTPVPQLLPVSHVLGSPRDHVPTVGFGPIAAAWPSRARLLGAHERAWLRHPLSSPLPQSFPSAYFQVAPRDQWLDRELVPNERIVLEGLHARHPRLVMSLSGLEPQAFPMGKNGEPGELLRLSADLLVIDTDRALATLTYRAQIPLHQGAELRVLVVPAQMGEQLSPSEVRRLFNTPPKPVKDHDHLVETMTDGAALDPQIIPSDDVDMTASWVINPKPTLPFKGARERSATLDLPGARAPSYPDNALPFRPSSPDLPGAPPPPPSRPVAPPPAQDPLSMIATSPLLPQVHVTPPAPPPPPPQPIMPAPAPIIVEERASIGQRLMGGGLSLSAAPPLSASPLMPSPPAPPPAPEPAAEKPAPAKKKGFDAAFGGSKASPKADKADKANKSEAPKPEGEAKAIDAVRSIKPAQDQAFSVKAASDSAAREEKVKEARAAGEGAKDKEVVRRAVVDLLLVERKIIARARENKRFAEVLAKTPRPRGAKSADEPRAEPSQDERDRDTALRLVSFGRPDGLAEVHRALAESLDDLTDMDPPLLLVAGDLKPSFDELDLLRATVNVAKPLASGDKKLLSAIAVSEEAINASHTPRAETLLNLAKQIEQACSSPSLPQGYVSAEAERVLVEGRKYKRRLLLGAERVRADLTLARSSDVVTLYLPLALVQSLPLLVSYPIIALVEVRPREDLIEPHGEALFPGALARVLKSRDEGA